MPFKANPVSIPKGDPFKHDVLSRRLAVESTAHFVRNVDGPFVLALNSPWGTGKSTFIRMLQETLGTDGYPCLYFDAWRSDFLADPLIAFVGELQVAFDAMSSGKGKAKKQLAKARKLATAIAKRAIPLAGKLATAGLLDVDTALEDTAGELTEGVLEDAVSAYVAEREQIRNFRETLQSSIADLLTPVDKDKVVIFVDELDRCRPTYAIDLLERVNHLFDIENVVFVLSMDRTQLGISIGAVYGEDTNSSEYLRRFIDLEFRLPEPDPSAFTDHLLSSFEVFDAMSDRTASEFTHDPQQIRGLFIELSDLLNLSLRAREQCFTLLRIAIMITPNNLYIFPVLTTLLAALRIGASEIYEDYALRGGSVRDVLSFLGGLPGGPKFLEGKFGILSEAYLLAAKGDGFGSSYYELNDVRSDSKNENIQPNIRDRASRIVTIVDQMITRDKKPPLDYVVSRLELASGFEIR